MGNGIQAIQTCCSNYSSNSHSQSLQKTILSEYILSAGDDCIISQYQLIDNHLVPLKKYPKVETPIYALEVTPDSRFFFIAGTNGFLQQYSLIDQLLLKSYGGTFTASNSVKDGKWHIKAMAISPDSRFLFTGDDKGWVKQYDIYKKEMLYDLGQVHVGGIFSLVVTPDSRFLFTSSEYGVLRQYKIGKLLIYLGRLMGYRWVGGRDSPV
jgi:WD40 repeat protein